MRSGRGHPSAPPRPGRRLRPPTRGARRSSVASARPCERRPRARRSRRRPRPDATRAEPRRPPGRASPRSRADRSRRRRARDRAALPMRRTRPRPIAGPSRHPRPAAAGSSAWNAVSRAAIASPTPSNVSRATHHPPSRIAPSTSSGARPRIDRTSSTRTARRSATRRAGSSVARCVRSRLQARRRRRARAARRRGVEDDPAGDRSPTPRLAQDEPVAHVEDERLGQRDPDEGPVGGHLLHVVEADPRVAFGRARVQLERAARRDRTVERSDGFDACLEDGRGGPQAGRGKDLAPRDLARVRR